MKLTTVQSQPFRCLFEALKEVLTDCNIHFDEKGMKILAIDGPKVALVHCRLHAENFQEYHCSRPFVIGVNVMSLFKLLKNITSDGMLTIFVDADNTDELGIVISHEEKGSVTELSYKLLDIDEDVIQIPDIEFDSVITMPSNEFQNICRNMRIISDVIEIKCARNELHMSCCSDFASNFSVKLTDKKNGSCVSFVQPPGNDVVYQGKFKLEQMLRFTKATSLSKTVELYLKNDLPIILQYVIADLGELKYLLAPKVEE
jgi:proliferating cell nuclear antigen